MEALSGLEPPPKGESDSAAERHQEGAVLQKQGHEEGRSW